MNDLVLCFPDGSARPSAILPGIDEAMVRSKVEVRVQISFSPADLSLRLSK